MYRKFSLSLSLLRARSLGLRFKDKARSGGQVSKLENEELLQSFVAVVVSEDLFKASEL